MIKNQIKEKVKEEVALLTRKPQMVVLVNPNDESSLGYVRMPYRLPGENCWSMSLSDRARAGSAIMSRKSGL